MKNKKSIAILMAAITLASCQSYKKVPYLQSYESLTDKSHKCPLKSGRLKIE